MRFRFIHAIEWAKQLIPFYSCRVFCCMGLPLLVYPFTLLKEFYRSKIKQLLPRIPHLPRRTYCFFVNALLDQKCNISCQSVKHLVSSGPAHPKVDCVFLANQRLSIFLFFVPYSLSCESFLLSVPFLQYSQWRLSMKC